MSSGLVTYCLTMVYSLVLVVEMHGKRVVKYISNHHGISSFALQLPPSKPPPVICSVVPAAKYCFSSWYACSRCKQGFRTQQGPHAVVEGHAAVFYRLTDQRPCVLLCRLPALSWTPALIVLQLQSSVPF